MHKLVIVIENIENEAAFEEAWPLFLRLAEEMPGLQKESTSRVTSILYGDYPYHLIHELYFDSPEATQVAMASPQGREAGRVLQTITAGHLSLFFADHKEDLMENILKYKQRGGSE